LSPDLWVWSRGRPRIGPVEAAFDPDLVLVPGASVLRNGRPSPVLRQRLEAAAVAARHWPRARIVLSGSASGSYDEPGAMRRFLVSRGLDSTRISLDRAGINTATSLTNLGTRAGRLAVVSQPWHLPRACWLAERRGWDVRGIAAGEGSWGWENLFREHAVRIANFWEELFHPFPAAPR